MDKLNNRYVKIAGICLLVFVMSTTLIAITNTYINPHIPFPLVLSIIVTAVIGWFAAKTIRY